jgi:CelD/BcsL family acetyltransferase involved in cellulose biosynthesis
VSAVNKATRAGLAATEAGTEEQWRDYVRVYGLSLKRWGDPEARYREDLFRTLAASSSGKIRLWIVEYSGSVIVGAICLYHGQTVVYWHGATDTAFQHLRAAPLLHAQIMRHAGEAGYRWYDFNPSGPNPGVVTFKERFGAVRRDVHSLVSDAPLKRSLRTARSLAGRVRGQ